MTRVSGQGSRTLINREFPHRVLVQAQEVRGPMLNQVVRFHENRGLPIKDHSLRQDDKWYVVYCFAARDSAESFNMLFGGELIAAQIMQ
jgi:hypothetical protein